MTAEKDLIVAIELGSSAIRGIIGRKKTDGSIEVLNIEEEITKDCVRKGVIYNIDKTIQSLNNIINKLQDKQGVYINKVYVGIGGQSLRTVKNSVSRQLDTKVILSNELVDSLMDTNLNASYSEAEILDVVPQEYRVGNGFTTEPVGILSDQIEGRFMNVVARSLLKDNIQKCVRGTGREVAEYFISSLALAENLLTDTEKRSGCALVDFGADTTTVAIFKNNLLRHLAVIPLGGNNITHDIANKQIEDEEAEALKIKYGSAFAENPETDNVRKIPVSNDRTLDGNEFQDIVEARMEEIIANVWEQISSSKYSDKLMAGIIITGGAANIKNLEKAFSHRTLFDKLKCGRLIPCSTRPGSAEEKRIKEGTLNTLISLLTKGNQSCIGEDPAAQEEEDKENDKTELIHPTDRPANRINAGSEQGKDTPAGPGILHESSTDVAAENNEETSQKPEKTKSKNSLSQWWKKLKDFSKDMVEE